MRPRGYYGKYVRTTKGASAGPSSPGAISYMGTSREANHIGTWRHGSEDGNASVEWEVGPKGL